MNQSPSAVLGIGASFWWPDALPGINQPRIWEEMLEFWILFFRLISVVFHCHELRAQEPIVPRAIKFSRSHFLMSPFCHYHQHARSWDHNINFECPVQIDGPLLPDSSRYTIDIQKCVLCHKYAIYQMNVFSCFETVFKLEGRTLNQPTQHSDCWDSHTKRSQNPNQSDE